VLPEQFTLELDFSGPSGWNQSLYCTEKQDGKYVDWGGIEGPGGYRVTASLRASTGRGSSPGRPWATTGA
jgi:hypothetical protein